MSDHRSCFILLANDSLVWLIVSDAGGREALRIVDGERIGMGLHEIGFDASVLPSGAYYYTLRTRSESQTRGMIVWHNPVGRMDDK